MNDMLSRQGPATRHAAAPEGPDAALRLIAGATAMHPRPGVARNGSDDRTALRALQASERRRQVFFAKVAHELRGPMQTVSCAGAVLERELPRLSEPAAKAVAILGREIARLARLVDDMLDLARMENGKLRMIAGDARITDVLDEAVDANLALAQRAQVRIACQSAPIDAVIAGDAHRLTQVFSNLVGNAVKFSEPGAEVLISTQLQAPASVVVRVRDSGAGIEPARIEGLFGLFAQDARLHSQSGGGLGIGLALARELVELHHGTVRACSAGIGRGSEFIVTLPLARRAAADPGR